MTCFPSSASASSCSSSSTSHLASPPVRALSSCVRRCRRHATPHLSVSLSLQQSLAEGQQLRTKTLSSPTQEGVGFLLKDSCGGGGGSSKNSSSCDTDDFVIVPAHFTGKMAFPPLQSLHHHHHHQVVCLNLTVIPCLSSRGADVREQGAAGQPGDQRVSSLISRPCCLRCRSRW